MSFLYGIENGKTTDCTHQRQKKVPPSIQFQKFSCCNNQEIEREDNRATSKAHEKAECSAPHEQINSLLDKLVFQFCYELTSRKKTYHMPLEIEPHIS